MALADNKAKIQALLAGINALPEAGSGEAPAPVLQEKSVTPAKEAQSITPDTGYDGLSKVNVDAIPDQYIVPSGTVDITANGTHNVREAENVNVNVPAPEITLQEKTVTPTTSAKTVTADSGYDGLSAVTVEQIPSDYVIPSGEKSITANGTHDVAGFASVNVAVEGGGSSGGAEMCTVTVTDESKNGYDVDWMYASADGITYGYINAHGTGSFEISRDYLVMFAVSGGSTSLNQYPIDGDAESIWNRADSESGYVLVHVYGDCTFKVKY